MVVRDPSFAVGAAGQEAVISSKLMRFGLKDHAWWSRRVFVKEDVELYKAVSFFLLSFARV
jgi:hypothetical protein